MKIIGETRSGFILEATKTETANLTGKYSEYFATGLHVGTSIEVHSMYQALRTLSGLERQMDQARGILDSMSKGLHMIDPVIQPIVEAIGKME